MTELKALLLRDPLDEEAIRRALRDPQVQVQICDPRDKIATLSEDMREVSEDMREVSGKVRRMIVREGREEWADFVTVEHVEVLVRAGAHLRGRLRAP